MNIIDLMVALTELDKTIQRKEKVIFNYFKVEVPEGSVLILPERYLDVIGSFSEKIIFSPYIEGSKGYIFDKSKMDNILEKYTKGLSILINNNILGV